MYFVYGETETAHLSRRDPALGRAIARIGMVRRETEDDLFAAVVHHIIGQQISTAAQRTIWQRAQQALGVVNPETIRAMGRERLQGLGISFRKADYILDFAQKVADGAFDVQGLAALPDEQVIAALSSLRGVGVWTAEMLLLFCLRRPDVLSYGDLAILRGMKRLYRRREIDRARFEVYRKRYHPYASVASLYLWEIAAGR